MNLTILLIRKRECQYTTYYSFHLNCDYAIHEWFTSRLDIPKHKRGKIRITKKLLSELLESCNAILADWSKSASRIPINTKDFPDQNYNNEYFDQIKETKKQLDFLFKICKGCKSLYYLEWY
jgi:hypothetical protein